MIIDVDGHLLVVPDHIEAKWFEQFYQIAMDMFLKQLPKPIRMGLKPFARNELLKLEQRMNAAGKDGKAIRPVDGAEPSLHYLKVMLNSVQVGMKDALVVIDSDPETHQVEAFNMSLPNPKGGFLTFGGTIDGFTAQTAPEADGETTVIVPSEGDSQGGRPLLTSGHIGERENNSHEAVRQGTETTLPNE